MKPFQYHTAKNTQEALQLATQSSNYLAGGTNQVDLMKKHIYEPEHVIDLKKAVPDTIELNRKGLQIGASATNTNVATHNDIITKFSLIPKAILAGASPQIRNMATTGGNLLQRTRCPYFYDIAMPCNKRQPGTGCSAINGNQRMAGIIGTSNSCVAVHPSDFCIALAALDAEVQVRLQDGSEQTILFKDFHRLPENKPHIDTNLPDRAIITNVFVPKNKLDHSAYVKIRERDSYAFALVSAAVALNIKNGVIKEARLASGGVAHKPWRWYKAEEFLKDKRASTANFKQAAKLAVSETTPLQHNSFKVSLLEGAIITALQNATTPKMNSQ